MDRSRLERLLTALHRTDASTPVLQRLCTVCTATIAVDGAGLSRVNDGRHHVLAASNGAAEQVEQLQVTLAEGPCVDAIASFRPSLEPDLAGRGAERWPRFASAAADHGIAAVFAFPLLTGGVAVGALDLYTRRPGRLDGQRYSDAVLLADLAALAVEHAPSADLAEVGVVTEAPEPWAHPAVVHHATGMVSEQLGIDVEEAMLRLRTVGFVTDRSVTDIARDVVARRIRIESWTDDG